MFLNQFLDDYIKKQLARRTFAEPHKIHVTELVQCKQKAFYATRFPEVIALDPRMVVGVLLHEGFQKWLSTTFNAKTEVEGEKEIGEVTIVGSADAIVHDIIIEIKYAKDVYNIEPYEHHIQQVALYKWLFDKKSGKLIYITPERLLEFDVDQTINDTDVMALLDFWNSPRYDWECDYCQFNRICPRAIPSKKRR